MNIRKRFTGKAIVCLLSLGHYILICGFPAVVTEAREVGFPIGEMVSRGGVKFAAKENLWKTVESSHFPVFQGGKIKTEKGVSVVTLTNNCRVEVGQNSILSFKRNDQLHLSQGRINFRIPPETEVAFKVRSLSVTKSRPLQAARVPVVPTKSEGAIGSIVLHQNGSVTITSVKGPISVLDDDYVVLAALSSKQSVTIPSAMASGKEKIRVAQAGEGKAKETERDGSSVAAWDSDEWQYLGLSAEQWITYGYGIIGILGLLIYALQPDDPDYGARPLCP
jgi:hypothetical protein